MVNSVRRRRALLGHARGTTSAEPMAHLTGKGTVSAGQFESKPAAAEGITAWSPWAPRGGTRSRG